MKLHKALKLRKGLVGEITKLKNQIQNKNSYLDGDMNAEMFQVNLANDLLMEKINELAGLKYAINEANQEIQSKIYMLSEYKALIAFWNTVPTDNGSKLVGYHGDVKIYHCHYTEGQKDELVDGYQKKVNALQEELDVYNYTTDIPWEKPEVEGDEKKDRVIPTVPPEDLSKLQEGHEKE